MTVFYIANILLQNSSHVKLKLAQNSECNACYSRRFFSLLLCVGIEIALDEYDRGTLIAGTGGQIA